MSAFERNLAAIEARWPELARLLRAQVPPACLVEDSATGDPVARLADADGGPGRLLASRYDPRGEAARAARAALAEGEDTIVLLGLGLGYAAEAILAANDEVRVLACDADPATLAACLGARDQSSLLAEPRLSLLVGGDGDAVIWAFEALHTRGAGLAASPAVVDRHPEWYANLRGAIGRWKDKERVNDRTLRRFGRLWVRNLSRNLDKLGEHSGISVFDGAFSGCPALILAAGPTLDAVLPFLSELKERMVLICVDTALRSLAGTGVEPDFLVVADPQYWNARHLDRGQARSSILITEAAVHPAVFRLPVAATALCSSLYPLGGFIEERAGVAKGRLGAGGSVSTSAWDFARMLGCAPLYLAGLDLAFPGGKTHARASHFEQKAIARGRRLAPASRDAFASALGGHPFGAVSAKGERVPSDQRLALYASWFEARLARHPEAPSFRLSDEGILIKGMGVAAPQDLLGLSAHRATIDAGRQRLIAACCETPVGAVRAVEAARLQLLELIREAKDLAERGVALSVAARAAAARGEDAASMLGGFDRVDAALASGAAKDVIGFLFPALRELSANPPETFEESLDISERIYRGIAESAAFHLDALEGDAS